MLVVATGAEKALRDEATYDAWGTGLSPLAYAARERRLRAHPFARQAMTTWLWKAGGGEVLASCETFRMAGAASGREGHAHGVASVFVAPALRGRGHASAMMQALLARLRAEDPDAFASILFSDVGEALYERAGYVGRVFPYREIDPAPGDPAATVDALVSAEDLEDALSAAPLPDGEVVVRPTAVQLDWHLERERIYQGAFSAPRPTACGARAGDALAVWYVDHNPGRLELLLLLAGTEAETTALLEAARRAARTLGCALVRHWESPADPPIAAGLGRKVARTRSLPMMAPLWTAADPASWTFIPRALWV